MKICIQRLKAVLDELGADCAPSEWLPGNRAISFLDMVNGTGRFTNVAEVVDADIVITVRLFAGIEGSSSALVAAYEYLLNLNADDPRVSIQRDDETGNVGASVSFACARNHHQLEMNLQHHLNILTSFLEARYDRILADLLEMGVKLNK